MRRIVSAKIKFLSLVPKGANQLPVIYKADDNSVRLAALCKAAEDFDEKGEMLSVVYAPEMIDSQGDIASAEVIKDMMYEAAREGFDLDIRHDEKPLGKDAAFVAESFVIQKGDPRFADFTNYKGEKVDVTGGWATVIKIEDKALRKAYRDGEWNGVSMGGTAEFSHEKQDVDVKDFLTRLAESLRVNVSAYGDIQMDAKELTALLKENNEALATTLVEVIGKILKPEETKGETNKSEEITAPPADDGCPVKKPVLKNATDPKAVDQYRKDLANWKLAKEVDWDDPDEVAEYQKAISAKPEDAAAEDEEAGVEKEDSTEVADLKRRLAKAQRRSNASTSTNDRPQGNNSQQQMVATSGGISKEDLELMSEGAKIGQAHNKQRGFGE